MPAIIDCDVCDWRSSDVDAGTLLLDDVEESEIVFADVDGDDDAPLPKGAVPPVEESAAVEEGAAELPVPDSVGSSWASSSL